MPYQQGPLNPVKPIGSDAVHHLACSNARQPTILALMVALALLPKLTSELEQRGLFVQDSWLAAVGSESPSQPPFGNAPAAEAGAGSDEAVSGGGRGQGGLGVGDGLGGRTSRTTGGGWGTLIEHDRVAGNNVSSV